MSNLKQYLIAYPFATYKLVRFPNLLILGLTQLFVAVFLIGPEANWFSSLISPDLWALIFSTVFITAGGYVINDYYDVKIDIINKPSRLVVGRTLPRRHAMFIHLVLTSIGLMFALYINPGVVFINAVAAFMLWWYSNSLKRYPLIGNVTVSALTGLAVIMVAFVFGKRELIVAFYALFAFFISLIREIIKDMEDVKGDKNFGCLTLPIKYGLRTTKKIIYVVEGVFVLSLIIIGLYEGLELLMYYIVLIIVPLGYFSFMLSSADTKKDFAFLSRFCKFIMICGVVSMIFI